MGMAKQPDRSKITNLLNQAVLYEHSAWYFYNHASAVLDGLSYLNLSKWFKKEAEEELEHAQIVITFINQLDLNLQFLSIDQVTIEKTDDIFINIFSKALEFEETVLNHYMLISEEAGRIKDCVTSQFCDDFLRLQAKEIKYFRSP